MKFATWQTLFDEYRMATGDKKSPLEEVFQIELQQIRNYPYKSESIRYNRLQRLAAEFKWLKDQKPYYNVHSNIVGSLIKTDLEKIPGTFIEIPNQNKVVCFQFDPDYAPIRTQENIAFHAIEDDSLKDRPFNVRSVLFSEFAVGKDDKELVKAFPESLEERHFLFIVDQGLRIPYRGNSQVLFTLCNTFIVSVMKDETIPKAIERNLEKFSEDQKIVTVGNLSHLYDLFKVIINVGFLCNAPEDLLVIPDVLNRDKDKLEQALLQGNQAAVEQIVSRAKRNHKNGYNVGTNEIYLQSLVSKRGSSKYKGTGKELNYAHDRTGHPMLVYFGEKKQRLKIKWIRPTVVRPDLPFKEQN